MWGEIRWEPSRGILEAVDFWLLSDFEISFPNGQPSRKTSLSLSLSLSPSRPTRSNDSSSGGPYRIACDQSYRRRVTTRFHGSIDSIHPVFCNLTLVSLDSEVRTMTSLASKT